MPSHRLAFTLLILILFIGGSHVMAQQSLRLKVNLVEESEISLEQFNLKQTVTDSLSGISEGRKLITELHNEGFLLAHLPEVKINEGQINLLVNVGPLFEWIELRPGNLDAELWRRLNFKESNFRQRPFRLTEVSKLETRILNYAERNSFPFASLKFDSLEIKNDGFSASLNIDFGPKITFDSVSVIQTEVLKNRFAGAYLGIQLGDPYDQRLVNAVVPKLRKLPFLRITKAPLLTFQNLEGRVVLEVERRRVNTIDGIIGLLPNSNGSNGLLLTGQFDLELYNPFSTGKRIGVHWRRLREETQTLELEYDHPNLLGSAVSLESDFNFLKQDSTFNRRILGLDLNINLGLNSVLGLISKFTATDLVATSTYQNSTALPDILDFRLRQYGLKYSYNSLDDLVLPRSGLVLEVIGAVGNKEIRQNAELSNEVYEGVDLKTLQYQYNLDFNYFVPLGNKTTLLSTLHGGWLANEQLFQNDTYRIGGLKSIRGFNEADFFATAYLYTNIESRFYLDASSYLLVFTDLGLLKENYVGQENLRADKLLGIGTGISFATNNGVFNFVYALGTSNSTGAINFNQSKIHFGFTTRF